MLHVPSSDRKTKAEASSKTVEPLPVQEGFSQLPGWTARSHQAHSRQHQKNLAVLQKSYGNQAVLGMQQAGRERSPAIISPFSQRGLLQRKCACRNSTGSSETCAECQKKDEESQLKGVQTKLAVNQPGDRYEQEADRMAGMVMQMPDFSIQRQGSLAPLEGIAIQSLSQYLYRLTAEEKEENLKSEKYAGNLRLEKAFDNDPSLGIGESGKSVQLVQEGLVEDGFEMPASTKPTGELDGAFGAETFTVIKKFQAKYGLTVDGIVGRKTMGKLDELAQIPKPPPLNNWSPTVDRIDIIDDSSGATDCFSDIMGDSDLNNPGPFNNSSTDAEYPFYGEVTNVHQVHFHLDRGESSQLKPERFVDATYSYSRISLPRNGLDGPISEEVCQPSSDSLAIADAPGMWRLEDDGYSYPFKLNAHFYLIVSDIIGHRIAQVEYNVEIEKTNKNNIPNKLNRIYPTKKKDLVRNRDL